MADEKDVDSSHDPRRFRQKKSAGDDKDKLRVKKSDAVNQLLKTTQSS